MGSTLTRITHLEKLGGYRLGVRFSDGSGGVHDFAGLVAESGPLVEPLRDERFFGQVVLDAGALTWPNGFDIDAEWLRRTMAAAHELSDAAAE